MEILSVIGLAVSPFVVEKITAWFKKIMTVSKTEERLAVIRVFVAILSVVLAVANAWLTDGNIDSSIVQNGLESITMALMTYWGASGIYLLKKDKKLANAVDRFTMKEPV